MIGIMANYVFMTYIFRSMIRIFWAVTCIALHFYIHMIGFFVSMSCIFFLDDDLTIDLVTVNIVFFKPDFPNSEIILNITIIGLY